MVVVVVEVAAAAAAVAVAAVGAGGGETRTTTVAMTAMTDTTNTTTGIVAGALHHLTTVDTGLAHGPAPTAHDDTKLLLSTFKFPPFIADVGLIECCSRGNIWWRLKLAKIYINSQNSYVLR